MRIKEVRYSKLASFGSYENETVGGTAEVEEYERPGDVLSNLIAWVEAVHEDRAKKRDEVDNLCSDIYNLKHEKRMLQNDIQRLNDALEENRDMIERFGIEWKPDFSDIPF